MNKKNLPSVNLSEISDLLETYLRNRRRKDAVSVYLRECQIARAECIIDDFIGNPYGYNKGNLLLINKFIRTFADKEQREEALNSVNQQLEFQLKQEQNRARTRYVLHRSSPVGAAAKSKPAPKRPSRLGRAALIAAAVSLGSGFRRTQTKLSAIGHSLKTGTSVLFNRSKYYLLGGTVILGGLWGLSKFKKQPAQKITPRVTVISEAEQTPQNSPTQTPADTLRLQADSIWNNYYDTHLEIQIGREKKQQLYNRLEQQLEQGIFTLPDGVSKQRFAFSTVMYRLYGFKSGLENALHSRKKLSAAEQNQISADISDAGKKAENLKDKAVLRARSHNLDINTQSRYDQADSQLQKRHIANLQQLRRLNRQK